MAGISIEDYVEKFLNGDKFDFSKTSLKRITKLPLNIKRYFDINKSKW